MSELDTADAAKKPKSAKKPATKKTATTTKRKTTATKSTRAGKKTATIKITEEQRLGMIAEAAYYKAEQRGFCGGDPTDDWLAAESEINALLSDNPAQQANA